jgi:hypothetical protein
METPKVSEIFSLLKKSSIDFYLGGSRYMQMKFPEVFQLSPGTDWDFYCTDSREVRNFLYDIGFRDKYAPNPDPLVCASAPYLDDECLAIYEYSDQLEEVQVTLRKNATFYRDVMNSVSAEYYYNELWKSSPKMTKESRLKIGMRFNQLFATAHSFE